MKTSDLIGNDLDLAVAQCERPEGYYAREGLGYVPDPYESGPDWRYSPSTDWSQGGPIIEREGLSVVVGGTEASPWIAGHYSPAGVQTVGGPTPLVAAMRLRCYVASK